MTKRSPAGGLIQHALARGAAVRVVVVTYGENNPWPQRAVFRRWSITAEERDRWREQRIAEARTALRELGLGRNDVTFLGQPDYGLTELAPDDADALVQILIDEIQAFAPTCVISPSLCDRHPDHNALALYMNLLSSAARLRASSICVSASMARSAHWRRAQPPRSGSRLRHVTASALPFWRTPAR